MIRADITDVNKRIKGLKSVLENNTAPSGLIQNMRETARTGRIEDATNMLKASVSMSIPFDVYMEVFDNIVRRGTVNDIRKAGNILCEEFVHKVRDAKHMMTVFKQRLTRANSKLKPKEAGNANDVTINTLPEPPKSNITESVKIYETLLEKATLYLNCDRLLENYNRVSKRFNLDKLFCENTRVNGVQDTMVELCRKIDTYNIPSDIRFNTVIETALYGFESNNIEYTKSDILEGAIEYYLFKKDGKEACKNIIENSIFFDKGDYMGDIDILTEEEPTEDEEENDIDSSMMEFCSNLYESKNNELINDYLKESDNFINEKLETLVTQPLLPKTITLYHGSIKKYDTIEPKSINIGTRLSSPRTSSFWTMDMGGAMIFAIGKTISKNNIEKIDHLYHLSPKERKILLSNENKDYIIDILRNNKLYLYEKTIDSSKVGRGHNRHLEEFTIDIPVTPDKVYELSYYDYKKYLKWIPQNRLDYLFNCNKKDMQKYFDKSSLIDKAIYHNLSKKSKILKQIKSESMSFDDNLNEETNNIYYENIIKETKEFKDIFNDYKKEISKEEKPEGKLKSLIHKLYSRDVNSIIQETPSLLAWIRTFFIIGTATFPVIGPVIMMVGLIADRFIQMGFERKDVMKMVKAFNSEMKKTQAKIDSTDDKETKDRLIKYLKSLEKARDKINEYHDSLITSEDMEKKYNSIEMPYSNSYGLGDDSNDFLKDLGLDFDDLDDDFSFDESTNIFYKISEATETLTDIVNNNTIDEYDMEMLASKLTDNDITTVAYIAQKFPDVFFSDAFKDGISSTLKDIRSDKIKFESVVDRVYRISALQKAQKILETKIEQPKYATIYEAYENVTLISETYEAIALISSTNNTPSSLLEGSISNKLNMASMKLRNVMNKLSDKDRQISKSVDIGLNNFKKGIEIALTNDNRESIIKGSILPSASKLIKLGIANAGLIAIHQPVIAIIGTLGYLGCSAKFKAKERQMLIDEIEIELKMCQKYIDIAEQKNDMKALKQLLMIQRDLQRQQQRIKYKMKVEFGQKYYDPKNVNTD